MRPFRTLTQVAAIAALLAGSGSARAGWDNVFQVCCGSCGVPVNGAAVAVAAPAVPAIPVAEASQPCTTRYVQRSYYQPVTTYTQRTYYEPVTSYRTSYYYEPVTSYRVSYYADPCSCGYQQVTTPVTSYRLRSQVAATTNYLQRVAVQPVQSYQLSYYYEPQTTCCQTTIGAPIPAPPVGAVAVPAGPAVSAVPTVPAVPAVPGAVAVPGGAPPSVGEQRQPQLAVPPGISEQRQPQFAVPPGVSEQREPAPAGAESQRYPAPASSQQMPRLPEGASYRPAPAVPPSVRLDRIVSATPDVKLNGQVVNQERQPLANVQLLFVSAESMNTRESTTADAAGKFQVSLRNGTWLVYTQDTNGRTEYRSKVELRGNEPTELRLVSR